MTERPAWPRGDTPEEVGFARKPMVDWLGPRELVNTGLRVFLSGIFGTYADKRELQAIAPAAVHDYGAAGDLWFDFVADGGDGFDATYTIAHLLARPSLTVGVGEGTTPVEPLPRGSLLILGGDQVYPSATTVAYRDRFAGPYRAALPHTEPPHPTMFAVPGNHDWYDGLTAFMRMFCQGEWIGGWKTEQTRSYFALRLPQNWWLWAVDSQFESYLDSPQLQFFCDVVAPEVAPGSSIILASATPAWVEGMHNPSAYDTLDFFERKVVRERCRSTVRLALSGDSHHYARYAEPATGAQRIVSGGGGAFTSATHHLPDKLVLPPPGSQDPGRSKDPVMLDLKATYPTRTRSKAMRRSIWRLPRLSPGFATFVGLVYALYGWIVQSSIRAESAFEDTLQRVDLVGIYTRLGRSPLAIALSLGLAVGLAGFTKAGRAWERWLVGLLHLGAHLAAIGVVVHQATGLTRDADGPGFVLAFLALVLVPGALAGSWVTALYLALADHRGLNTNELFAAQRFQVHKNFLRLHVRHDGHLEVFPVGVDQVDRGWRLRPEPEAGDGESWFSPSRPGSGARLIEDPIVIPPAPGAGTAR